MSRRIAGILILAVLVIAAALLIPRESSESGEPEKSAPRDTLVPETESETAASGESRLESVSYQIIYEGKEYQKSAEVYIPASYYGSSPMNVLYLLHGSQGSAEGTAEVFAPLLDEWIAEGEIKPMLVVFPTYYPDPSFVVPNYSQDYPLNHFFAEDEITVLIQSVEGTYHTYAESTDEAGIEASRTHRAFGGYSMGGVTTWDVLAYHPDFFAYFMPMAGDCWLDRAEDLNGDEEIADFVAEGMSRNGYGPEDFHIMAMVGGSDGTRGAMIPQIEALRENHSDLINDQNLEYWENAGGGHNLESFELEAEHGIAQLFQ
ncbi:MAG: alpha/beta hydrolase [Bulleidia sp.]